MQVFADHYSSQNPIDVPRSWIWDLPRRTVYFGTSVPTIFRGIAPPDDNQECGSCMNIFPFPPKFVPYKWRAKYSNNQVSCSWLNHPLTTMFDTIQKARKYLQLDGTVLWLL
jgi:hypothetical protein